MLWRAKRYNSVMDNVVEPVTFSGAYVRLEPLSQAHVDGIMRAGADDEIWRWLPWRPTLERLRSVD